MVHFRYGVNIYANSKLVVRCPYFSSVNKKDTYSFYSEESTLAPSQREYYQHISQCKSSTPHSRLNWRSLELSFRGISKCRRLGPKDTQKSNEWNIPCGSSWQKETSATMVHWSWSARSTNGTTTRVVSWIVPRWRTVVTWIPGKLLHPRTSIVVGLVHNGGKCKSNHSVLLWSQSLTYLSGFLLKCELELLCFPVWSCYLTALVSKWPIFLEFIM